MTGGARGFTLLELMVAVVIFSVVIGSIYLTLRVGVDSFHQGERNMETYQSVRIGLERFGKDLRCAVSPESPWSNLAEEERQERLNMQSKSRRYQEQMKDRKEEKQDSDITFIGSKNEVAFVLQDVIPGGNPTFDLREIRYWVDDKEKVLLRQAKKSIVSERIKDWRSLRLENETNYQPDFGMSVKLDLPPDAIIEDIESVEFAYFDGEDWRESWDSNELIREDQENYDQYDTLDESGSIYNEEEEKRLGLPHAVRVELFLVNKDSLFLTTEIPARDIDDMANETAFRGVRR